MLGLSQTACIDKVPVRSAMLYTRSDIYYTVDIVSIYRSNSGLVHWTRYYILIYGGDELCPIRDTASNSCQIRIPGSQL